MKQREGNEVDPEQKLDYGIKDVIAMIIAAFELVIPPFLMISGALFILYIILRFKSGL